MGLKVITLVALCILQASSLPLEDTAPVAAPACSLQEAMEINTRHLQEISDRVDSIDGQTNKLIEDSQEHIKQSQDQGTTAAQDIFHGVQLSLEEAKQRDPAATPCLDAVQIQIQVANVKTSYNLAKCSNKFQKKELELRGKALKVQQKAQKVNAKASSTIGKCVHAYYPLGTCAQLEACSTAAQAQLLHKIDTLIEKISLSAQELNLEHAECVNEAIEEAEEYVLMINLNVLNCSSPQPIPPVESEESNESNEEGTGTGTEAPEVGTTEKATGTDEPQVGTTQEGQVGGTDEPENEQTGQEGGAQAGTEQTGQAGGEQTGQEGGEQTGQEGGEQTGQEGGEQTGQEGGEQGEAQTGQEGGEQGDQEVEQRAQSGGNQSGPGGIQRAHQSGGSSQSGSNQGGPGK